MPSWQTITRRIRVPLGFLFAALYIWLAHPSRASIISGGCTVVLGLVVRGLASGHVQKNERLTTSGPYAHTRNPLYLGSLILAVGFIIAARSWIIAFIAIALFLIVYVPVIDSEEAYLRSQFPEFDDYSRNVPRLFPRVRPYQSSANSFSWHLYKKHREYNAAIGTVLLIMVLIVKVLGFSR